MLAFCNNAGPAFLFGILGTKFTDGWTPCLLWGIHLLSAIAVAIILPRNHCPNRKLPTSSPLSITQSLKTAVVTMCYICGWIVLMRVILAIMDRWILWIFPAEIRIGIYGFVELANGCCSVASVSSQGLRFILSGVMLAFGGICVTMQTASLTGKLGIKHYLIGKILQTVISFILCALIQFFVFSSSERVEIPQYFLLLPLLGIIIYCVIQRKKQKRSSISALIGV